MPERTFLCRCEDVTVAELDHAAELGLRTLEEIKRYTGLGTGPCQGKECMATVVTLMIERGLVRPEDAAPFTARPPTEPVTFGALAAGGDPEDAPEDTR